MSCWFKHDDKSWSTEASDMKATGERVCPACKAPFSVFATLLKAVKDGEGEVTHWEGPCACGASLVIFND